MMHEGGAPTDLEAGSKPLSKLNDPYLDLLKKCLTRFIFLDQSYRPLHRPSRRNHPIAWTFYPIFAAMLKRSGVKLYQHEEVDLIIRSEGRDWPAHAETMIGLKRLDNLHACIEAVIRDQVPGDFIETGVWRGGACIFMRAALNAYAERGRASL